VVLRRWRYSSRLGKKQLANVAGFAGGGEGEALLARNRSSERIAIAFIIRIITVAVVSWELVRVGMGGGRERGDF